MAVAVVAAVVVNLEKSSGGDGDGCGGGGDGGDCGDGGNKR